MRKREESALCVMLPQCPHIESLKRDMGYQREACRTESIHEQGRE